MISSVIEFLAGFIISGINALSYWGVFFMMVIESACIPLPSEIIMPFSGYLVSRGEFTLLGITLAGAFGNLVGSILAYWAGIKGGRVFIMKYGKYFLMSEHDLNIADNFFHKYGNMAVFLSRMMPVVRTFISLPAGIAKMPLFKFSVYTFLGSLPWCLGLGYLGKELGDNWDTLGVYFHKFDLVIGVLIVAGVAVFVKRHLKKRRSLLWL